MRLAQQMTRSAGKTGANLQQSFLCRHFFPGRVRSQRIIEARDTHNDICNFSGIQLSC